jgi:NADPH-dependent curcumin reductase CurA
MTDRVNRQFTLAARPQGAGKLSDFKLAEVETPSPKEGEVLFRNTLFSIDPYQRNLMGNGSSEWLSIAIGDPMGGPTVGVVEQSRNPDFSVGDHVQSWTGWRTMPSPTDPTCANSIRAQRRYRPRWDRSV